MLSKDNIYDISNYLFFHDIKRLSLSNRILNNIFKSDQFKTIIEEKYKEYRFNDPELRFFDLLFDQIRDGVDIGNDLIKLIDTKLFGHHIIINKCLSIYFNTNDSRRSFFRMRSPFDWAEILNDPDEMFPLGYWNEHSNYVVVWTSKAELFAVSRDSVLKLNINYQKRKIKLIDYWDRDY